MDRMGAPDYPPPYSPNPPPVGFDSPPPPGPQQEKVTVVGEGARGTSYGTPIVVTAQPQVIAAAPVVILGATCPACRAGVLQNEFTGCGICLGICFFPIGLICCFLMQERRCSNCRMSFGNV